VDCFDDAGALYDVVWQCANLTVPLDYRNGTGNATTVVGIARGRPKGLETPIGALFPNYGGPSASLGARTR
jgi:hypothetical protein